MSFELNNSFVLKLLYCGIVTTSTRELFDSSKMHNQVNIVVWYAGRTFSLPFTYQKQIWFFVLTHTIRTLLSSIDILGVCILGYPGWFRSLHQPLGQLVELPSMYRWMNTIISLVSSSFFGWAGWPMKTILTRMRLSDWTARYNASYRFSVADSKLF